MDVGRLKKRKITNAVISHGTEENALLTIYLEGNEKCEIKGSFEISLKENVSILINPKTIINENKTTKI